MAIYHFSAQVISRSQGRSSVAAAAYRSAEKIKDEKTNITHDFTKKNDVLESEILLPNDAPSFLSDRKKLWNAVEQTEKRKDAQVAREINIALPKELTHEQNWQLAKDFVKKEFVDKGMIADVNFHSGHKGGEEQPHVHVMLTLREVTKEGFGQKNRAWNDKGLLNHWREAWANDCNRELARHGFDIQIDNRTLEAQGINLEPQSKIGAKAAQLNMARFAEHQALAERNGERLLQEPEIALTALSRQQSTFTHHDIARFVNRHSVDEQQFQAIYEKVKAHPELIHLGKDDHQRDRYTTKEMLGLETKMLEQAQSKSKSSEHRITPYNQTQAMVGKSLSLEQQVAFAHITSNTDISCVVGFAGTGKSYLLGAAREAWEAQGYQVQGMALSGIAAESLEGGSNIKSYTVANRLWHWEQGRERLTFKDIVVVDEAGMLGSRQMAHILDEATRSGAKVVLVGDSEQLQAIEAGAAYRAISQHTGFVEMTEIRRQVEPWQQQATKDFATTQTEKGLRAYEEHDNIHVFHTKEAAMKGMVEQWDEARSQAPNKSQIMLAYTRDEVQSLNERARTLRQAQGELGHDHPVETSRGSRTFAEGDRIYFLRNVQGELRVKNGTLGTIEKIERDQLQVKLDRTNSQSARTVAFNLKDYNDIDHGYAATVYKAQGITVDRSHVLASSYFDRHSTYVAMSRHREGVDLYYDREEFLSFTQLSKTLSRERTKDVTLDYGLTRHFEGIEKVANPERSFETHRTQGEKTPTQRAHFDDLLQQGHKASLRNQETPLSFRADFSEFKAAFEAQYPNQAETLKESLRPRHERLALEAQKQFQALEKTLEQSPIKRAAREELEKQAASIAKQKDVMGYLKQHNPHLSQKIEKLAKTYHRQQSMERDY